MTALDSDTGEERWTFFADGPVRFAPLAWEGKVYFVSTGGKNVTKGVVNGTKMTPMLASGDAVNYRLTVDTTSSAGGTFSCNVRITSVGDGTTYDINQARTIIR